MGVENILNYDLYGNSGQEILFALGVFLGLFILFEIINNTIVKFLKKASRKTKMTWDDVVIDFIDGIGWQFFAFLSFYFAIKMLVLSETIDGIIEFFVTIIIVYYIAKGIIQIVEHFLQKEILKRTEKDKRQDTSMIKVLGTVLKIIIWVVALLMILSNLGIEITPLIAGLGVGGIAIALALQTILGDLFSAFAIYLDKPFQEGDFIIVGNDMGVVKHIGIKTTRVETLQGQELVVSNSELTSTRINNYKRMSKRRILFSFGVTYDTPVAKLKKIPKILEKITETMDNAQLDRAHFKEFGDFSLNYEVVYYVQSSDYNQYMDIQQEMNLKLKEAFEKEKIEFAFPTQTIHLEK